MIQEGHKDSTHKLPFGNPKGGAEGDTDIYSPYDKTKPWGKASDQVYKETFRKTLTGYDPANPDPLLTRDDSYAQGAREDAFRAAQHAGEAVPEPKPKARPRPIHKPSSKPSSKFNKGTL